jgi:excinuclease ABC subunit B
MRTEYDLELLQEMGFCNGIENYSRHLSGRRPGERPFCLIDFFPNDFLLISTRATPQSRRSMRCTTATARARSAWSITASACPARWTTAPPGDEFFKVTGQTLFVSATPREVRDGEVCRDRTAGSSAPPACWTPRWRCAGEEPGGGLIGEVQKAVDAGERVLVTTLTKRMSEDLTSYLRERKVRVEYCTATSTPSAR